MIVSSRRIVVSLLLLVSTFTVAHAQTTAENAGSGWGLGLKFGTTGAGIELTRTLSDRVNLRLGYNDLSYDTEIDDNGLNYTADISRTSGALMLDWHPWGGSFRLSAGVYGHSDNAFAITAVPVSGSFEFNGTSYPSSSIGSVIGEIDMGSSGSSRTTPYVGLGWGNAARGSRLSFLFELGLQFQQKPGISIVINDCSLPGSGCTTLVSDVEAEVGDIREDIKDFENWPVMNLGISFRF